MKKYFGRLWGLVCLLDTLQGQPPERRKQTQAEVGVVLSRQTRKEKMLFRDRESKRERGGAPVRQIQAEILVYFSNHRWRWWLI